MTVPVRAWTLVAALSLIVSCDPRKEGELSVEAPPPSPPAVEPYTASPGDVKFAGQTIFVPAYSEVFVPRARLHANGSTGCPGRPVRPHGHDAARQDRDGPVRQARHTKAPLVHRSAHLARAWRGLGGKALLPCNVHLGPLGRRPTVGLDHDAGDGEAGVGPGHDVMGPRDGARQPPADPGPEAVRVHDEVPLVLPPKGSETVRQGTDTEKVTILHFFLRPEKP